MSLFLPLLGSSSENRKRRHIISSVAGGTVRILYNDTVYIALSVWVREAEIEVECRGWLGTKCKKKKVLLIGFNTLDSWGSIETKELYLIISDPNKMKRLKQELLDSALVNGYINLDELKPYITPK